MTTRDVAGAANRRRILPLVVVLVLASASALGSIYSLARLSTASEWIRHASEVQFTAAELLRTIVDAETGQRGYLATGDTEFLDRYNHAVATWPAIFDHLVALTRDNPSQQSRLADARALIVAKMNELASTRQARDRGVQGADLAILMKRGKTLMDQIRVAFEGIQAEEARLATERTREQLSRREWTAICFVMATLLFVIAAVHAWFQRRREVERAQHAEQEVVARDEFMSIASHELRTPLSTLRLQTDGLLRLLRKGVVVPEQLHAKVQTQTKQLDRIEALVSTLLDVSRLEAGRLNLEPSDVDLSHIAKQAADALTDSAKRAGTTLTVEAPRAVVGRWDIARLDLVITNLLTNAIKYGGGKPVEVGVIDGDKSARVTVTDHGIGIAPEDHERIFRKFERAADPRHFGGIGLGLWLTRQIIMLHGGTIRVTSALGAGATFIVELPKEPPAIPG